MFESGVKWPQELLQMFHPCSVLCIPWDLTLWPIQFMHLNQPGVEHLIRHLADRHASAIGHGHKGAFDVGEIFNESK